MSLISGLLEYRLSGGSGNSDPDASIGGVDSSVEVINSTGENLFSNVTDDDAASGSKKYRCIYLYNKSLKKISSFGVYLAALTKSANTKVFVGKGTSSKGISGSEPAISDEDQAPSGVSFFHPTNEAAPLALPDLPSKYYLPLWVRRDTTVGADGAFEDYVRMDFTGNDDVVLDVPFNGSLVPLVGEGQVVYSRASSTTYFDSSGVLKTAQIDEPVFDNQRLRMQRASNNYIIYSNQLSNGAFAKSGCDIAADVLTAPDGAALAADKIVEDLSTGFHYIDQVVSTFLPRIVATVLIYKGSTKTTATVDLSNDNDFTFARADVDIQAGTIALISGVDASIDGANDGLYWVVTLTGETSQTLNSVRVFVGGFAQYTGDGVSWVGVGGIMVEDGSVATAFIETADVPVSRAGDLCRIAFEHNHPSLQAGSPFTVLVSASSRSVSASERQIVNAGLGEAGVDDYSAILVGSDSSVVSYNRSATGMAFSGYDLNSHYRYGVTVDENQLVTLYVNGVAGTPATHDLLDSTGVNAVNIGIGCRSAGDFDQLDGYISRLVVFNRVLSAFETGVK